MSSPLSAQTVKHHHRLLCKVLNDAIDWEFVETNVAKKAKPPKPMRYKPVTYTESELKRLLEAAKQSPIYSPIIYTAGHTGGRLGELRPLKWKDIDFDSRKIYITKTAYDVKKEGVKIKDMTKNGRDRYVVMGKHLLAFLKKHWENHLKLKKELGKDFNPLDLVFPSSVGTYLIPSEITRAYKRAIKRVELPDSRFHDLRHSHATILLLKNVHPKIVSDRLGHSKISITLDLYSHAIPSLQDGAVDVFDEVFDD
ncbi:tyrosine-type recombinase/integrase [Evansella sp. AB-rgal1]|uniref:tyrosine-type recombinase/integrase n=1 Tax=Evansella sp. AB-rgal1 TaxID=3242696 RepID=UPI00359EED77